MPTPVLTAERGLRDFKTSNEMVVLDHGSLVEQGTHAQLLAADGLYAHLHRMQFRDEPEAW